ARVAFSQRSYACTERPAVPRVGADGIDVLDELRGGRAVSREGSLAYDLLRAGPGVDVVLYEGVEEPYLDLERGRLAAVVLDNIIAARYGLPRPTLREAGTVGEGVYAIALRPDEPELLAVVDGALAAMMGEGELHAILARWSLWDGRQEALAATAPASVDPGARGGLTLAHLPLFLRGAALTVVGSVLAMALAV